MTAGDKTADLEWGYCGACGRTAIRFKSGIWFHADSIGCGKAHAKPDPNHPAAFRLKEVQVK